MFKLFNTKPININRAGARPVKQTVQTALFCFFASLGTTQVSAQETPLVHSENKVALGSCEVLSAPGDREGHFTANGSYKASPHGVTTIACSVGTSNKTRKAFESVSASVLDYEYRNGSYGRLNCHVRYVTFEGRYRGAIYKYAWRIGNNGLSFKTPDWFFETNRAVLYCKLGPLDELRGYSVKNAI